MQSLVRTFGRILSASIIAAVDLHRDGDYFIPALIFDLRGATMRKRFFFGGRAHDGGAALPSVEFDDGGERRVLFTLPPTDRSDLPSALVFAMPKSGSVLLDGIMRKLSASAGVTYVSIMQEYFAIGLPDKNMPADTSAIFLPRGYCYGGFRYFPRRFDIPILKQSRPVLLVRDPRDMLVSHYFSMRDSHPEPGKVLKSVNANMSMRDLARALEIDDYVKRAAETFRAFLMNYRILLCGVCETRMYRYEDVIYQKPDWVAGLAAHFGWDISRDVVDAIAAQHDVIPSDEVDTRHIRQVHPGNYIKKLRPETIRWLDDYFKEEMAFFGYKADVLAQGGGR
ncbi:protein of unknown function [Candidatus Filomicrobium marinum]|nr:protein of unknown function [Candidatus Filomicrobium marinum]